MPNEYVSSEGEVVTAVQYLDRDEDGNDLPPPDGVTVEEVEERDGFSPGEKAFIATKDSDGDGNVAGALSSIADGTWIITHEDRTVSLCHPTVFDREFSPVSD